METHEPHSSNDLNPAAGQPTPNESSTLVPSAPKISLSGGLIVGVLLAALLSALACWGLGEKGLFSVIPDEKHVPMMGSTVTGPTAETRTVARHKEAAITYGVFGALTASMIGFVMARKQGGRSGLQSLFGGLILGGVVGAGIAAILAPVVLRYDDLTGAAELVVPLLTHGGIFAAIGVTTGIAASLGTRDLRQIAQAALGGALGAFAGAFIYEIVGAMFFPMSETSQPISASWMTRLLALALASVGIAVGTLLAFKQRPAAKTTIIATES